MESSNSKRRSMMSPHRLFYSAVRVATPVFVLANLIVLFKNDQRVLPAEQSGESISVELQPSITLPVTASGSSITRSSSDAGSLPKAMDDVVRMLFPPHEQDRAEEYIQEHWSPSFRFYVYDSLPKTYRWDYFAECIESRYNTPDWHQHNVTNPYKVKENKTSNCDWGSSICTERQTSSSIYSSRRFNRNGDVVLSKIFSEYQGSLRTFDPTKADVFIVPYAASAHCACDNDKARCAKVTRKDIETNVLGNLKYYSESTKLKHVFFSSVQRELNHPYMKNLPFVVTLEVKPEKCPLGANCGQIIQPYVNTNGDFQPNSPNFLALHATNSIDQRKYALGAYMSRNTGEKNYDDRKTFLTSMNEKMQKNQNVGGRPVFVAGLQRRVMKSEADMLATYRNSVFCPTFRGNTPAQKRLFDAWLTGCIPVVFEYEESDEKGYSTFFRPKGTSVRIVYPFSQGLFHNEPFMGIDYRDLVVRVNGTCGISCLVPTLEDLLQNHPEEISRMQKRIASVATLFTYGMEDNALKYPDAIAAILVQIRHFLLAQS